MRRLVMLILWGALMSITSLAWSRSSYISTIPNGSDNSCLTCHTGAGGGRSCPNRPCLNTFGQGYQNAGFQWSASLAGQDADGDGWSNGQELGDPFALWSGGASPVHNATLPGDATSEPADFDLCTLPAWNDCDAQAMCVDMFDGTGSWSCACAPGFTGGYTRVSDMTSFIEPPYTVTQASGCQDINECTDASRCGQNLSNTNQCNNTPGSYSCSCGAGFVLSGTGNTQTCVDVDECADTTTCGADSNAGTCANTPGGYTCMCAAGFKPVGMGNTLTCVPNDPCAVNLDNCDANATCTPSAQAPGYTCMCNIGYVGSGTTCDDVDECTDAAQCGQNLSNTNQCNNAPGSYSCSCGAGFVLSGTGNTQTCVDVDECADTTTCGADVNAGTCANNVGGYDCLCATGFQTTGQGDSLSCEDVDECTTQPSVCGLQGTVCTNTQGAYNCTCQSGYAFDGVTCVVENPCTAGTDTCADDAICTPAAQSPGFSCACKAGFAGDGTTCADVDECIAASTCNRTLGILNVCANTPGSYTCTCATGFMLGGTNDAQACVDIDECTQTPDICGQGVCTNTPGGYTCTCSSGFEVSVDGSTCVDIDECASANVCGKNLDPANTCTNSPGDFVCQCSGGYALVGQGPATTCADVDECADNLDDCSENELCTNTPGDFECTCKPGFVQSADSCVPEAQPDMGTDMTTSDMSSDMPDMDMAPDASDMNTSTPVDMSTSTPNDSSDCACRQVPHPTPKPWPLIIVALSLGIAWRRRRA